MFKKILRSLVLLLTVSFGSWAAADTVTLMQGLNGYAGTTDDKIACCSFAGTNMGNDTFYAFIAPTSTSLLIKFNIFASEGGPVPNDATINSATLSFYQYWGPTANWSATRLKKAWNETAANWTATGSGANWTTAGAFSVGNDIESAADGSGTSVDAVSNGCNTSGPNFPAVCWLNIPVTAGVQAFKADPLSTNFGWKVIYTGGSPDPSKPKEFNSSENTQYPSLRPKLTIDYTPVGCTPTASLSATPSSGQDPLNVSFSAANSSAPSGHAITGLQLTFGDGSSPASWSDQNVTQPHTYNGANVYTASLTVTNDCGTSTPATQVVTVTTDPGGDDFPPATPPAGALGTSAPTFHSMSLYYNPQTTPSNGMVWMRYRRASEQTWREGLPLWFDPRTTGNFLPYAYRARGSAVSLEPNTKYYFEFGTGSSYATATWLHNVSGTTWGTRPDNLPDQAGETTIAAGSSTWSPPTGGDAVNGYKVYNGNGATIDVGGSSVLCMNINKPYVVVKNVICKGGTYSGIEVADNVTNVVIENVDVSDFGQVSLNVTGWGPRSEDEVAAVRLGTRGATKIGNNSKIVVQRSKLHTPRNGANPWDYGHPSGAFGIFVEEGGQQNVFRYNEIYSIGTQFQWFQDGIGGTDNFGAKGAPGADSDIYQNIISNTYDDGIEAEGGGRNVRVWGNYIDRVAIGIATAAAHFGPTYVWRNVINRTKGRFNPSWDADERERGFKTYGLNEGYGGGRKYFFHNTFLQTPGSTVGATNPLGAGDGNSAAFSGTQSMQNTWSYNNIYHIWKANWWSVQLGDNATADNAFNYDLYNGGIRNTAGATPADGTSSFEQNGTHFSESQLIYKPGNGWSSVPSLGGTGGSGNYQLETGSVGLDAGKVLPNFNDGYAGSAPDAGAHEQGAPAMTFGIGAN